MNLSRRLSGLLVVILALPLSISAASAQSVRVLGDFNAWSAYSASGDGSGKLCFVLSKPEDVRPSPDGYTQSYLYLTHRPAEGVRYEFNFVAGFDLAPERSPQVRIGAQSFDLFIDGAAAWLDNPALSEDVAGLMRAGASMTINVTAADGTEVAETYSLSGVTAASRAIDRACN